MQIIGEKIAIFNLKNAPTRLRFRGENTKNRHSCSMRTQMANGYVLINPVITPLPLPEDTLMIG